jgi:hypothetical protein
VAGQDGIVSINLIIYPELLLTIFIRTTIGYYQGAINETVKLNDGLMFEGSYNGKSIGDVLAFGDWLDYHKIPVLNQHRDFPRMSVTEVGDYFYKMLLSFSINYAWRQQNVYMVSFPMTEDECMFFFLSFFLSFFLF